jgi:PAS domain S-box-containing protein
LRYERLEGITERSLEELTKLIADLLGIERCVVCLVHPDDGWLRTVVGVDPKEAREYAGFCAYAMLQPEPAFIDDAREVDMLAHVPKVSMPGGIRMFAGTSIITSDKVKRGAVMLLHRDVKKLTEAERKLFLSLAAQVRSQVEQTIRINELRGEHAAQMGALSMLKGLLKAATTFAIIGTDNFGRVTLFNEGAERVFGISAKDASALTPVAFLDGREMKARAAQLSALRGRPIQGFGALVADCDGDAPIEHTWTMRRADGTTFPGLMVVARVAGEDDSVAGYAFIARDITEQRAVERMKDDFVSMVSHELRTPLTAIRGALGLAAGGVAGSVPEGIGELLRIAHSNTERLLRIVNDILDIHRLESGALDLQLDAIDVLAVVERAVELTQPFAAEYGVSLHVADSAARATVMADFERWVQVVVNLLSNAAKYSPSGSRVDIDVVIVNKTVRLSVADRGPGIPEEFSGRIFQKFAQAATGNVRRGGTGLGLSIVKSLVDLHGGTVGFESSRGKGTTFYVDMPLIDEK